MTVREKIRAMVMTANSVSAIMDGKLADKIVPHVLTYLNEKASGLGHSAFDYERSADEYPEILYKALWLHVRAATYDFLEEHHPEFHNKSFFMASTPSK